MSVNITHPVPYCIWCTIECTKIINSSYRIFSQCCYQINLTKENSLEAGSLVGMPKHVSLTYCEILAIYIIKACTHKHIKKYQCGTVYKRDRYSNKKILNHRSHACVSAFLLLNKYLYLKITNLISVLCNCFFFSFIVIR